MNNKLLTLSTMLTSVLLIAGCSNNISRNPLTPTIDTQQAFSYDKRIRMWGDTSTLADDSHIQQNSLLLESGLLLDEDGDWQAADHLTISGGGADGAYGAGLLNGITESGQRPDYRLVTGISTGAIIGLYAFLGEQYNDKLREFYTQTSDQDLYQKRSIFSIPFNASLLNTSRFENLVRQEINAELLHKVKKQHLRGKTFLVKTTNLDAQRPVIWNMGEIAMYDNEHALKLFQDVIIASAAVPVIFNPVLISVNIDGEQYDEMHVDGGVTSQVFFIPNNIDIQHTMTLANQSLLHLGLTPPEQFQNRVWVISNARLGASWHATRPAITDILGRSATAMLKYQNRNNVMEIFLQSQQTNSEFLLSYIPHSVPDFPLDAPFNTTHMRSLYCYGYLKGKSNQSWHSSPPNYEQIQANADDYQVSGSRNITLLDWDNVQSGLNKKIEQCLSELL